MRSLTQPQLNALMNLRAGRPAAIGRVSWKVMQSLLARGLATKIHGKWVLTDAGIQVAG
jgi:hypothetical protein